MAVKLRMQRHGSKKRPFYYIVAANSTSPRDGKFIEKLGTYNPLTVPATVEIDRDRALDWLQKGAQPTHTVRRILSFKGVLYMKHLMRGVAMGLFDEAAAKEKFEQWIGDHEKLVSDREEAHRKTKHEKRQAVVQESVRKVEEKNAARKAELKKVEDEEAAANEPAEDIAETTETVAETTETVAETPVAEEAQAADDNAAETPEAEVKAETEENNSEEEAKA